MVDNKARGNEGENGVIPTGPEWRSKVVAKPPELVAKFPDMGYKEGMTVIATGPRGEKVLTIHKHLGNGKYQLKDGDKVQTKVYDEADIRDHNKLV
ncbi:hypothetical protein GJ744_009028 [Endocarpon pusillum]|uniref:Uncharacterized protein n=1 Tax=Endocarpon pusillum TaxID=364733 RepID=A0A8H7AK87_9EURO|nr:hypothetical protein GJ744_009028 [Endocarpon pusillum]